jgi:cell division protein FtsN
MAKGGSLIGNVIFWLFVLGASGGAFAAGFYFTYGMTLNVNTRSPVAASTPKPGAIKSPIVAAKPTATPTLAPGPIPVPSAASGATPTPVAVLGADPSPEPTRTPRATPTPQPVGTPKEEIYRVQVGAFDSRESAQKQVEELQSVGINAVVVYDGGAYHAQLGAFSDRARAISVADEVNTRGYSVTIRH